MLVNDMVAAIRAAFDKRARGLEEWIDGTVELAILFAAARDQHESDQGFGRWLVDNDLDEVNKDDRAALITMGRRPGVLRIVLAEGTSVSPQMILRGHRPRFLEAQETDTLPAVEAEVGPPALAEPAMETPPVPADDIALPGKVGKVPGLVELLGEELGRPLYNRFNLDGDGSPAMSLLVKVGRMRGGRAALTRYAEVMRDHPDWKPARYHKKMTVALVHVDMGSTSAIERNQSPDGLLKVVARALEIESSRNRPPPPAPNHARRPPRAEPHETPREDAAIVVCGKVIREKGHDPDNYPMVWAAYRAFAHIDGYLSKAYPKPGSRATIYGWAVSSIRDVDSDILASVWLQISNALRNGDPDGETSASPHNIRVKR